MCAQMGPVVLGKAESTLQTGVMPCLVQHVSVLTIEPCSLHEFGVPLCFCGYLRHSHLIPQLPPCPYLWPFVILY